MSSDISPVLPRKKPSVLWWLAGFFFLLLVLFILQLFGPSPPIIVSPQTTYITEPLGPNGLPDYERHFREQSREGVTPENNAAVLLWEAMFPADVETQYFSAVSTELGLDHLPLRENALVRLQSKENEKSLLVWLERNDPNTDRSAAEDPNGEIVTSNGAFSTTNVEAIFDQVVARPWTSDQLPPLKEWVIQNEAPLDLLVEASRRPRFYAPSPTLIDNRRDMLISILLVFAQSTRDGGRAVCARAMWHAGEGRHQEAWQDLLAVHRLARLSTQGNTLVEHLIAFSLSNMACDGTAALLSNAQLPAEVARQIQRDLAALPNFSGVARSLDKMERLAALDAFTQIGEGEGGEAFAAITGNATDDYSNNTFNVVSVDWNFVLRETNRWYDRLAAAARTPDRAARQTALDQIDADIMQLAAETRSPGNWAVAALSRPERSQIVAGIMLSLFLPAVSAATNAEDRANANLELVRTVAAIAIHRAPNGSYPETLEELVPAAIDRLPVDPYSGQPFLYKRLEGGYLLYSVGENGRDDGASSERDRILSGQPLDDLGQTKSDDMTSQIPTGADDISIRVPRPKFRLPEAPPPAEAQP